MQSPSVDSQHAIIEYRDIDETFALQDLNTTYGTYVNDCRIGNAYVRLHPGDVIRFGNSDTTYELLIHGESSVSGMNCNIISLSAASCQPRTVLESRDVWNRFF